MPIDPLSLDVLYSGDLLPNTVIPGITSPMEIAGTDWMYGWHDPTNSYYSWGPGQMVSGTMQNPYFQWWAPNAPNQNIPASDVVDYIQNYMDYVPPAPPPPSLGDPTQWGTFHDNLVQEQIAILMTAVDADGNLPQWAQDRLSQINTQLSEAAGTLGRVPRLEMQEDGTWRPAVDGNGNIIYQSNDEMMANLLAEFQNASDDARFASEQRYSQLVGGTYNPVTGEWEGQGAGVMSFPELAEHMRSQYYMPMVDAWEESWMDQDTSTPGFQGGEMWQGIAGAYDALGQQARQDIGAAYDQAGASLQQDMIDRGLYNTSVAPSMQRGLTESEAQEMRRLDESLAAQQMGAYTQAVANQIGTMGGAASAMGGLYGAPLSAIMDRTDVGPSLSDIANLSMQLGQSAGQQYPLLNFQPSSWYGNFGGQAGG